MRAGGHAQAGLPLGIVSMRSCIGAQIYTALITLLLGSLVMPAASNSVWAAETWVSDPKAGCQIALVSDDLTLVSATWSGGGRKANARGGAS